jgi:GNAT superfamily N-acetyltransferase
MTPDPSADRGPGRPADPPLGLRPGRPAAMELPLGLRPGRPAGTELPLGLRPGLPADVEPLLALMDEIVAWLVARDRSGQWGSAPMSGSPAIRTEFVDSIAAGILTVATRAGTVVGAVSLDGNRPPYVPTDLVPPHALWVHTLATSRSPAGRGAGALLLDHCRTRAAETGAPLALDHWSGSPELAALYARAGYREVGTVVVPQRSGPWHGTVRVRA